MLKSCPIFHPQSHFKYPTFLSLVLFLLCFVLCLSILPAYVSLYHVETVPVESEEGIGYPRIRATNDLDYHVAAEN